MTGATSGKVLGVGLAVQDVIVLWDDFSKDLHSGRARELRLQGGGMTGTALVASARLGAQAELRTVVGDDGFG